MKKRKSQIKESVTNIDIGNSTRKIIHIVLLIIGTILICMTAFHTNLDNDQAYTILINGMPIKEAYNALIKDVHPIFYYTILRLFTQLFGNTIISCRIFSILPIIILAILRIYSYSKRFWRENRDTFFLFGVIFTSYAFRS